MNLHTNNYVFFLIHSSQEEWVPLSDMIENSITVKTCGTVETDDGLEVIIAGDDTSTVVSHHDYCLSLSF